MKIYLRVLLYFYTFLSLSLLPRKVFVVDAAANKYMCCRGMSLNGQRTAGSTSIILALLSSQNSIRTIKTHDCDVEVQLKHNVAIARSTQNCGNFSVHFARSQSRNHKYIYIVCTQLGICYNIQF